MQYCDVYMIKHKKLTLRSDIIIILHHTNLTLFININFVLLLPYTFYLTEISWYISGKEMMRTSCYLETGTNYPLMQCHIPKEQNNPQLHHWENLNNQLVVLLPHFTKWFSSLRVYHVFIMCVIHITASMIFALLNFLRFISPSSPVGHLLSAPMLNSSLRLNEEFIHSGLFVPWFNSSAH